MTDAERAREIAGMCESAPLGRTCDGWQSECRACGIARRVRQALAAARAEEREAVKTLQRALVAE